MANNRICEMLGYSHEEILSKSVPDIHRDEDLPKIWNEIKLQADGKKTLAESIPCLRKDGSVFYSDISTTPVEFDGNNYSIVFFRDVTERKQAGEALWESEKRYRELIDNMGSGVAVYEAIDNGEDFIFKDLNKAGEKIEKINREALIGKRVTDVFPGMKDFGLFEVFQRVWKTGKSEHFPVSFYKDERINGWRDNFAYKLPSGEIVAVYSDETEHKQAEQAESRLQAQLANAVEIANLGPWEYDVINDIFTFNDYFYKIFRTTPEQIGGYTMKSEEYARRFVHPDEIEIVSEETRKAIEATDQNFSRQLEHKIIYDDGSIGYITVRFFIVKDEKGNTIKTYGVNQDITERKLALKEKQALEAQLQQAQKLEAIGNLAGGIAHDFNNILYSIIGYTELCIDDAEKGTLLEANLQEVYTASKRARDLVKQILTFARRSEEKTHPIQIKVILKEVLKFIRSTIPSTITISQNLLSDSLINGNPTQLYQVFMNLCTNAAQAMEDSGGALVVGLEDVKIDNNSSLVKSGLIPGSYIKITVSDTGSGISPELIDMIFEPYFTTKDVGEGTGLGLSVVHGIVEGSEGKIYVDSTPGKGTVFTIYWPVIENQNSRLKGESELLPRGTENILIIDDELNLAEVGARNLKGLGYSVFIKSDSLEALETFKRNPESFDLVITDMTMPNITGDKLALELMKIKPDIPVILCTGFSKQVTEEQAFDMGIKALFYKPVLKSDLAKTVREVLDEGKSVNSDRK